MCGQTGFDSVPKSASFRVKFFEIHYSTEPICYNDIGYSDTFLNYPTVTNRDCILSIFQAMHGAGALLAVSHQWRSDPGGVILEAPRLPGMNGMTHGMTLNFRPTPSSYGFRLAI